MRLPEPGASKSRWRTWARGARRAVDFDAVSRRVRDHLRAWSGLRGTVLAYLPLPDEIDLLPLVEELPGCRFVVTRTEAGRPLTLHELRGPLERHRLGFLQPPAGTPEVPPADVDVALLPGLAFDRRGVRLGRGGGHFDELLSRLRQDAVRVGVAPAAVVVPHLPSEPHDRPVDVIVTEEGLVVLPSRRGGSPRP